MLNMLRNGCLVKIVKHFDVASCWLWLAGALVCSSWSAGQTLAAEASLTPGQLRCEYLVNPPGIDETRPRLSWVVESGQRGQRQTAYQILVASDEARLRKDQGDLWDTGKVASDKRAVSSMAARRLASQPALLLEGQSVGQGPARRQPGATGDVGHGVAASRAIGRRNTSASGTQRRCTGLRSRCSCRRHGSIGRSLPPAKPVCRATIYATALGIYELHLNGQRVGDALLRAGLDGLSPAGLLQHV